MALGKMRSPSQVDEDRNVEEVREDVVHEALKCCGGVGESKGHHAPLKGSVSGSEGSFPFVTFADSNEVVGMLEINFGEYPSLSRTVKEVSHSGEWVAILLRNLIEPSEVDPESKRAILFTSEYNQGSARRPRRVDEAHRDV